MSNNTKPYNVHEMLGFAMSAIDGARTTLLTLGKVGVAGEMKIERALLSLDRAKHEYLRYRGDYEK